MQDITRDWGIIRSTATEVLSEHGIVSTQRRVPLKGQNRLWFTIKFFWFSIFKCKRTKLYLHMN